MANYNLGTGFTDTQDNQKYFSEKFVDSDTFYSCPVCGRLSVLYRPEIDEIKKELE